MTHENDSGWLKWSDEATRLVGELQETNGRLLKELKLAIERAHDALDLAETIKKQMDVEAARVADLEKTINRVIKNLDNTISGKEKLLAAVDAGIMNQFIKINLDELRRIRQDLMKIGDI
jgi:hypothetical protein